MLYDRLSGDDGSMVVDSSRREDRDRSRDDVDDSAGSRELAADGQQQAPGEAKPAKCSGDPGLTESAKMSCSHKSPRAAASTVAARGV